MEHRTLTQIPLDLLDDNPDQIRSTGTDPHLQDLIESIKQIGLLHPLLVKPNNGRYTILDGHRRRRALELLTVPTAPCIIRDDALSGAEIALHSSTFRSNLSPLEEGIAISTWLLADETRNPAQAAQVFARSKEWIMSRLETLTFPPNLQDAIHAGLIPLGAARELNQIPLEFGQLSLIQSAIASGITVPLARQWRKDAEQIAALPPEQQTQHILNIPTRPGIMVTLPCFMCEIPTEMDQLTIARLCPRCRDAILNPEIPGA